MVAKILANNSMATKSLAMKINEKSLSEKLHEKLHEKLLEKLQDKLQEKFLSEKLHEKLQDVLHQCANCPQEVKLVK